MQPGRHPDENARRKVYEEASRESEMQEISQNKKCYEMGKTAFSKTTRRVSHQEKVAPKHIGCKCRRLACTNVESKMMTTPLATSIGRSSMVDQSTTRRWEIMPLTTIEPETVNPITCGGWEELEISIDSGATEIVMGEESVRGVPLRNGPAFERGAKCEVANGVQTPNLGETKFFGHLPGRVKRAMTAQVCTALKCLMSVSKMAKAERRVVFDEGSYIEDKATKEVIWMEERNVFRGSVGSHIGIAAATGFPTAMNVSLDPTRAIKPISPVKDHNMKGAGSEAVEETEGLSQNGEAEEGTGQDEKEEAEGEGRPSVGRGPKAPTKMEQEEHARTHCPYRSWCRHCV